MNPKILILSLAFIGPMAALAQNTPAVKYYRCQTECFAMGSDGSSVYYTGGNRAYSYESPTRAFRALRNACNFPNLHVHRDLKEIVTTTRSEPTQETIYTYTQGWGWSRTRERYVTYTITNTESKATFKTQEATEANSCKEISADDLPPVQVYDGSQIFG